MSAESPCVMCVCMCVFHPLIQSDHIKVMPDRAVTVLGGRGRGGVMGGGAVEAGEFSLSTCTVSSVVTRLTVFAHIMVQTLTAQ